MCIAYKLGWSSGLTECHKVKQVETHIHQPTKYLNNNLNKAKFDHSSIVWAYMLETIAIGLSAPHQSQSYKMRYNC